MATQEAFDLSLLDPDKVVELDVLGDDVRSDWRTWCAKWATEPPFYAVARGYPMVVLGGWSEVRDVLLDRERFSTAPPPGHPFGQIDPIMGLPFLNKMDGPRHDRLRRVMQPFFSPASLEKLEGRIRALVAEVFDAVDAKGTGEFDALGEVGEPVVARTLTEVLIDVEPERGEEFRQYAHKMPLSLQPTPEGDYHPEFRAQVERTLVVIEELLEERRKDPTDDMITAIVQAVDDGFPVTHEEVLGNILATYGGAQLATATSCGVLLWNLAANPEQFQLVREDRTLMAAAAEESVRQHPQGLGGFPRFATEDLELAGTKVWEGMSVYPAIAAANQDPVRFPHPERFDIRRSLKGAMPFSVGAHQCIGARLARMVMQAVGHEFAERYRTARMAVPDFQPVYGGAFGEFKPTVLPLAVESV